MTKALHIPYPHREMFALQVILFITIRSSLSNNLTALQ